MKPLALIILDGWGSNSRAEGNAILAANTPNFDSFLKIYPHTSLNASGLSVGLPKGQMGNSEVGHLNIGAGRVVYQDFTRINMAIKDGSFFENSVLLEAIENAKLRKSNLHFIGLLSDGGVHSHINHIKALLKLAKERGLSPYIHACLDGRDVSPRSALTYVKQLEEEISRLKAGQIATICGRYYCMDRDKRWDRVKRAYDALVYRQGEFAQTASEAVENSYKNNVNDEFVLPTVIRNADLNGIKDGDSIIFFNFRPDRAREITRAFIDCDFKEFDRGPSHPHVFYVCMTQYDATFDVPVAFGEKHLKNILTDVFAQNNLKQLRLAETEKYAHVTFFFNGGEEDKRPGEDRILIPSPKVSTYDLKPEMSAYEVTDAAVEKIEESKYDVIIINFANPDMVGHTGVFRAAKVAVEVVDECLGKIVTAILDQQGEVIITADHGNAETMEYESGKPYTAHTTDKVPFIYITDKQAQHAVPLLRNNGGLSDIAPTILDIMGINKPEEMTGTSLLVKAEELKELKILLDMKIYNTLTRKKEEFVPLNEGKVSMYVCGPTVYNYIHIGNGRAYICFDMVRRWLEYNDYEVKYVRNLTDVDDKIINRANEENLSTVDIARKYTDAFHYDMDVLGVLPPNAEPKATETIGDMIELIKELIKKGNAYEAGGDVYFNVLSFKGYGKLSGRNLDEMIAGLRVEINPLKKNPLDFALWKKAKEGEPFWDSPWGHGRPGWHIECSTMAKKHLGQTFDIHGGGQDLIFPHHENEIAQSETTTGKQFVRYWMHNGFLNVEEEKMAKSVGNVVLIKDLEERYKGNSNILRNNVRMLFLSTHYRSPINFSDEKMSEAQSSCERIQETISRIFFYIEQAPLAKNDADQKLDNLINETVSKFSAAMNDDFNTPIAISHLFDFIRTLNSYLDKHSKLSTGDKEALNLAQETIIELTTVLGFDFTPKKVDLPLKELQHIYAEITGDPAPYEDPLKLVKDIVNLRQKARADKDFQTSDLIRDKLTSLGFEIEDTPIGPRVKI